MILECLYCKNEIHVELAFLQQNDRIGCMNCNKSSSLADYEFANACEELKDFEDFSDIMDNKVLDDVSFETTKPEDIQNDALENVSSKSAFFISGDYYDF